MKIKHVVALGISQYELFQMNYLDALVKGEQETIHQFRVALKRFYALKKYLLYYMNPEGQAQLLNLIEPLRLVYKSGGKVRDIQVIVDVALNSSPHKAPDAFIDYLKIVSRQRLDNFIAVSQIVDLPSHQEFALHFKKVIKAYYKSQQPKLEDFLIENMRIARFYITSSEPGELWHNARTLIKQNYLLMQLAITFEPDRFSNVEIQYYREMEQILGEWHDWVVLKKNALRFELTRASAEIDSYLKQVSLAMDLLERTVLNRISV